MPRGAIVGSGRGFPPTALTDAPRVFLHRADDIRAAREEPIPSRRTHPDRLAHKPEEEKRVRRVVGPIPSGGAARHHARDLEHVRDLGRSLRIHRRNPICREMVPREPGRILQSSSDIRGAWYVDDDGRPDMTKLPTAFNTFFREHSEHRPGRFPDHPEAAPQLILRSYPQRVVNGGGRIEREYGADGGGRPQDGCGAAVRMP